MSYTKLLQIPKLIACIRAKATTIEIKDVVITMDMAKGDLVVASKTQVVLIHVDIVTTVAPKTLQSGVQLLENPASTAPELALNLHSTSLGKDMNDLEPEAHYPEQFHPGECH